MNPPKTRSSFRELEIAEEDLSYLDQAHRLAFLLDVLRNAEVYDLNSLYSGIDGLPIKSCGSFGDRQETWAVTEDQFRQAAQEQDRTGTTDFNPLSYALSASDLPAIAVLDQSYFENQAGETHDEFEWKLADGTDMDQSALAVVYITH